MDDVLGAIQVVWGAEKAVLGVGEPDVIVINRFHLNTYLINKKH